EPAVGGEVPFEEGVVRQHCGESPGRLSPGDDRSLVSKVVLAESPRRREGEAPAEPGAKTARQEPRPPDGTEDSDNATEQKGVSIRPLRVIKGRLGHRRHEG